jgi:hypothetical protein
MLKPELVQETFGEVESQKAVYEKPDVVVIELTAKLPVLSMDCCSVM